MGSPVSRRSESPDIGDVDDSDMIGCHVCGAQATCFGQYDNMTKAEPACDRCCGHGGEDGACFPLGDLPDKYHAAIVALEELLPFACADAAHVQRPELKRAREILAGYLRANGR